MKKYTIDFNPELFPPVTNFSLIISMVEKKAFDISVLLIPPVCEVQSNIP